MSNIIWGSLAAVLLLTSCSTTNNRAILNADPNVFHRRDINIKDMDDNLWCQGVCVWPRKKKYRFKLYVSRGDYGIIETCAQQRSFTDVGRSHKWEFNPDSKLEYNNPYCPMRIRTYDYKREMHQYAYVLFEHPDFKLKGTSRCNNRIRNYTGVGVCQNKVGLKNQIDFKTPVKLFRGERCKPEAVILHSKSTNKSFKFKVEKPGIHLCEFVELQEPYHKMLYAIVGYEQILIPRGDNQK